MMLIAARRICFKIVNPKIMHDKFQIKQDRKLSFYPIVGMKQTKTGVMFLNKPDNNNNVTQQCADQLYRFLTTYHHDHTVENVWMENRGPAFSGGADYQQLLNNPHYLDKLMRLSIRIGQFNKPIFAKIDGSVRGIAAYILTMFSTPLGTQKSSLRLDETSKGFVPIFGGSHRLSRLPCNIGMYLALTGDKLDSFQMARLGILKGKVRDEFNTKKITRHLSDANLFMRYVYTPSCNSLSEPRKQAFILRKMHYFYDLIEQMQSQLFKDGGNLISNLAHNQYRLAQTQYYNTITPFNSFSKENFVVNNYFQMRHDRPFKYMKQKGIVQDARTDNNLIPRLPVYKLLKIFNKNNLYQVMEELSKDESQWARRTQQMIRQKDPLSLHLTFNLIKNAKNNSWVQCLEEQYKVARRLLNVSKIKHIQISKARTLKILHNPYSEEKIENIPQQKVNQFMRPYQNESQIFDHDTPNHSFLPTSDYWKQIPDAARNYLNRTFFEDIHSKFGEVQVKRFLHLNKIDYRDRSYNISTLREYLYNNTKYARLIQLQKQRLRGILQSQINLKKVREERKKYMDEMLQKQQLPKIVAQQIKNYFEKTFKNRFDQMKQTANIAGKQSRMQTIRKYVKTLTENIVMNGRHIQQNKRDSNLRHGGIVRFDNEGSDVFHAETPAQKAINQLNPIKKAYKTRDLQEVKGIDPQKPKNQYIFFNNKLTQWQYDLLKKDAALRLNYNTSISQINVREKYKRLMQSAASTSQQITNLLGWQDSDIQTMLFNAPKHHKTFKQFAEKAIADAQDLQERVKKLNLIHQLLQNEKKKQLAEALTESERFSVKNMYFDSQVIPRPFRQVHLALLEQVLSFFTQKYQFDGSISSGFEKKDKNVNLLNEWALSGLKTNFTSLMKNDVHFVFSYLVLIHLKEILLQLQKQKMKNIEQIIPYIQNKFGVNFVGMNFNQFNKTFMRYMYYILDLHEQSKHKIIFPQSKMIQFLKRLKIQKQNSKNAQLSFQSLMFMIAKDRKMIKDSTNNKIALLGYDPQITLNALNSEQKENNTIFPEQKQYSQLQEDQSNFFSADIQRYDHLRELSMNKSLYKNEKKQLVLGFDGYLRRFEAMLQKVAGRTMFLPKQLYEMQNKKIYQSLTQLLNVELSNQQWFKLKLRSAIKSLFEFRLKYEKNMTEGELKLFDEQFCQFFTKDYLGLVLRYQDYSQQGLARVVIKDAKKQPTVNDQIKSLYLQLRAQMKNPRALKLLNNLIMTQHIVKDKIQQLDTKTLNSNSSDFTFEQKQELQEQRVRIIGERTIDRLIHQAFRYSDENNQVNQQNKQRLKIALNFAQQIKQNRFMSELKQINEMLDGEDLKAQLQNRIRRIQALNL